MYAVIDAQRGRLGSSFQNFLIGGVQFRGPIPMYYGTVLPTKFPLTRRNPSLAAAKESTRTLRSIKRETKMVKMQSTYVLLCLLPLVKGDRETAFNIKSLSCSGNSATLEYASCGFENADPCTVGEGVTLKGTYTVNDSVPQTVQACGAIQIFGIGVYDAGCQQNVDICDYMDW